MKHIRTMLLAALLGGVANDAFANEISSDAVLGGAIGGGAGAAVGSAVGGRNGAIIGGALGAATGVAIAAPGERQTASNHDHEYRHQHHDKGYHRGHYKHRHHDHDD
jgi:hypothetical protein